MVHLIGHSLIHHKVVFEILPPGRRILATLRELPHLLNNIRLQLTHGNDLILVGIGPMVFQTIQECVGEYAVLPLFAFETVFVAAGAGDDRGPGAAPKIGEPVLLEFHHFIGETRCARRV